MKTFYAAVLSVLCLVASGCDSKKANEAKDFSGDKVKSPRDVHPDRSSQPIGNREEGSGKPSTIPVSSLYKDGLMRAYKDTGAAGIRLKLDSMGPGKNRRKAITDLIHEASIVEGGLADVEFAEILKLIDGLPYDEDKGGLNGPPLNTVVEAQTVDHVMTVMSQIESQSLKLALATSLGVKTAAGDGGEVAKVVDGLDAAAKVSFLCSWADRLPKAQKLNPDGFGKMLARIALAAEDEKIAVNSFVNSLGSTSSKELLAYSKTAANPVLADELLTRGYSVWLKEDSMAASAELVKSKDSIEPHAYDKIAEDLVMQLQLQHDLPAANQWAATVNDEGLRMRLLLFLKDLGDAQ